MSPALSHKPAQRWMKSAAGFPLATAANLLKRQHFAEVFDFFVSLR